ncbi:hypothetical protein Stsp01_03800 [Streptomyces sp. NBRC 13847]|uniref:hypothetical protein n=1 Tax=Streptomyces TaxID=1883 RepID=UPI0024A5047B|nr:hypothetical protein [Streptomyces sp. NBRC 13847]GLW13637.1 hypothetical protein Stsp01_03800 [Streptomyces sp. NBRC 13847]
MDQGQAAVWAAAIAIPGVLLSGVLSYRAGRRQVRDQGVNEHQHWLRQQRQEHYVQFLQAVDLCVKALEAYSGAVVSVSDRLDTGEIDASTYNFTPLFLPRDVLLHHEELGKSRDGLLMIGPETVDERAQAVFIAILNYWSAHCDVLSALQSGPQSDDHPAWSALADADDALVAKRGEFIAAARSVLTGTVK